MTSGEMEQRNVAAMGAELGKQYTVLFQEFATLNLYWNEFIELFGSSEKRVERLNRAAPGFFRMVQDQQFESNMLHLARLTDSPKSVGRENLTIQRSGAGRRQCIKAGIARSVGSSRAKDPVLPGLAQSSFRSSRFDAGDTAGVSYAARSGDEGEFFRSVARGVPALRVVLEDVAELPLAPLPGVCRRNLAKDFVGPPLKEFMEAIGPYNTAPGLGGQALAGL